MATQQNSGKGPWIIAGAIVLVGVIMALTLVLLKSGNSSQVGSPSPGVQTTLPTNHPSPSPPHTRGPKPSPSATSPSPSASPQVNMELLLRQAVEKQANKDRPGEVKHVGFGGIFKNKSCASKQQGVGVVRFTTSPTPGQYLYCWTGSKWSYQEGPTYGG